MSRAVRVTLAVAWGALLLASATFALPREARAESWTGRRLVLPSGATGFDVGFALAFPTHREGDDRPVGDGLDLGISHGLSNDLELGLRFGFRFNDAGRAYQADHYARLYDNETYENAHTTLADPEIRLRWALVRGSVLELAFEGRVVLPLSSDFVIMPALPLRLHLGAVRVDSGVYVPIIFAADTTSVVSIPLQIWIQATSGLWLGPLFGVKYWEHAREYPVGFGLGTSVASRTDLRFQVLIPNVEASAKLVAFGLSLAFRF
jgi:hypothetical protein